MVVGQIIVAGRHTMECLIVRAERRFQMADFIATPTMGEILREEFMEPMSISAYKLAQEIHVQRLKTTQRK